MDALIRNHAVSALVVLGLVIMVCAAVGLRRQRAFGVTLTFLALAGYAVWFESIWVAPPSARVAVGLLVVLLAFNTSLSDRREVDAGDRVPSHAYPGLVLSALGVYLAAVNIVLAPEIGIGRAFGRLLPGMVWACVAYLAYKRRITLTHFAWIVLFVFGAACVSMLAVADPWAACSEFKCTGAGELLAGVFRSENSFARLACLATVAALALGSRRSFLLVLSSSVLVLVASNSRTSMAALFVSMLAALALVRSVRRRNFSVLRLMSLTGLMSIFIAGWVIVYTSELGDFSNRGTIWSLGRAAIGDSWLHGRGIDNWTSQVLARNYMHSEALFLMYAGGFVAVLLFLIYLAVAALSVADSGEPAAIAITVLVMVLGVLEVIMNLAAIDGTTIYVVAMLIAVSAGGSVREASDAFGRSNLEGLRT